MLMNKQKLNYERHCKIAFGTYVQANQQNEQTNNNKERTIDGIYLRPIIGRNSGHEILNLATGKPITRPRVWEVPLTDSVIKRVKSLAKKDGIKSLKLTAKNGDRLLTTEWEDDMEYEYHKDDDDYSDNDDESSAGHSQCNG